MEAPGVEFVVMQDALGGDAHRGVRKTGVEGQWELVGDERRHGPGVRKMRRLSARHLEAEAKQEAARLALCVWGQLGQVMEKAPGVVFVVKQDAVGGGAHQGVRKAGVEGQWELARVERRHGPGLGRNR